MPNPHLKPIFPTQITNHDSHIIWAKPDKSKQEFANKNSQINYPNPSYNIWADNYRWYDSNRIKNTNYFGISQPVPYVSDYIGESYGYPNKPQTSPIKTGFMPEKNQSIYGWG